MTDSFNHASVVAIEGAGIALIGPSGSGKSDLALRLIDRGATLVGDDYVLFNAVGERLRCFPNPALTGRIEIRGIGIASIPYVSDVPLRLCVELGIEGERMPMSDLRHSIAGYTVPMMSIMPYQASAPIRIEYKIKSIVDADVWPIADQPYGKQE